MTKWVCEKCSKVWNNIATKKFTCVCGAIYEAEGPGNLLKLKNFTVASIGHFLKGNPTCQQDEIDYRLSICKVCDFFTGIACSHRNCGCNISDQQIYLNKLAWSDQRCPLNKWGIPLEREVTICITTFLRPDALKRLQESIKKYYPSLKVLVVDTKGNLSWGRNYLVKQVTTPYLLLLEDDFIITEKTNIRKMVQILQEDKELGMIGGQVGNTTAAYNMDEFRHVLQMHPTNKIRINGYGHRYAICDYTDNFGLFRREVFGDIEWDEELEIHEHLDFFYRFKQLKNWRIGVAEDIAIKHERPRPSPEYKQYRKRNFVEKSQKKLGLKFTPIKEPFQWTQDFNLAAPPSKA